MSLHLVGYTESQDSATLANIAAMADDVLRVNGDDVVVPVLNRLYGAYFNGANITQARIDAPSLRDVLLPDIEPLDVSAEPTFPTPWHWFGPHYQGRDLVGAARKPLTLKRTEALRAMAAEDAAGAARCNAFYWLGSDLVAPPEVPENVEGMGEVQWLRATATTTLTAFAWTPCTLTFTQGPQAGYYAALGLLSRSAGALAGRYVTPNLPYRPGTLACDAVGDAVDRRFLDGSLGVLTAFDQDNQVQVEMASVSADTAETFYIPALYLGEDRPEELFNALRA